MLEDSIADTTLELKNLRTDTEYSIDIVACYDEDCLEMLVGEPIQAPTWRTEIESWFFPDINGDTISPLFSNAYAPALIDLSELPSMKMVGSSPIFKMTERVNRYKSLSCGILFIDENSGLTSF